MPIIVISKYYFKMLYHFIRENTWDFFLAYGILFIFSLLYLKGLTTILKPTVFLNLILFSYLCLPVGGYYFLKSYVKDRDILINHDLKKIIPLIRFTQIFCLSLFILLFEIFIPSSLILGVSITTSMTKLMIIAFLPYSLILGWLLVIQENSRKKDNPSDEVYLFKNRKKTSTFRSIYFLNLCYLLRKNRKVIKYGSIEALIYIIILFLFKDHITYGAEFLLFIPLILILLLDLNNNTEMYDDLRNYTKDPEKKAFWVDVFFWTTTSSAFFIILFLTFSFLKPDPVSLFVLFPLPLIVCYVSMIKFRFLSNSFTRNMSMISSVAMPLLAVFFILKTLLESRKK